MSSGLFPIHQSETGRRLMYLFLAVCADATEEFLRLLHAKWHFKQKHSFMQHSSFNKQSFEIIKYKKETMY
jgi:hypothetical protein